MEGGREGKQEEAKSVVRIKASAGSVVGRQGEERRGDVNKYLEDNIRGTNNQCL